MFVLHKSYYVNVSWGQRVFYKGIGMFLEADVKAKINLSGNGNPQGLMDLFHPC